jgi:hypothetical protein
MSTTKAKLWFTGRTTALARQYSKLPLSREPESSDYVWLPIGQIEHTTKYPGPEDGKEWPVHIVTIPQWLADKNSI